MARQDKDGFFDPALVATWRRMLWLMRGSADVLEALVPTAAGMTKDEISRLLARAGAPSGKGVEPVEQVLGLLGVVPRARYEALVKEYEALVGEYEELGARVEEAEQNIDRLRRMLREQGLVDEAEQLLDSWGGLVRRTLRAQAGFMRSITSAGASPSDPASAADGTPRPPAAQAEQQEPDAASLPAAPRAGETPRPAPAAQREPETATRETAPPRTKPRPRTAKTNGTRSGTRSGRSRRPD
ncbi:MAG: hypothetical protein J2P43_01950 [Candidatus Dormibacteraeota bacterium]|nr:hypothetical protein [Candidatus Dormibacteraeota bacterium]